jgi:hypothetical protein
MIIHPSIHLEIARQRHEDRLARAEGHRIAEAAHAGARMDRGGSSSELRIVHEQSRTTTRAPQRANA